MSRRTVDVAGTLCNFVETWRMIRVNNLGISEDVQLGMAIEVDSRYTELSCAERVLTSSLNFDRLQAHLENPLESIDYRHTRGNVVHEPISICLNLSCDNMRHTTTSLSRIPSEQQSGATT